MKDVIIVRVNSQKKKDSIVTMLMDIRLKIENPQILHLPLKGVRALSKKDLEYTLETIKKLTTNNEQVLYINRDSKTHELFQAYQLIE